MKRWLKYVSVFTLLFSSIFYWYLLDGRLTNGAEFEIDITQLRQLANSVAGEKPSEIQVEKVAQFYFFSTLAMAGSGFKTLPMGVYVFRLRSPEGDIIIDSGYDQAMATASHADFFVPAYERTQQALSQANKIVIIHGHKDHIGGILRHKNLAEILPKVMLSKEQLDVPESIRPRFPQGVLESYKPLRYENYHALQAGVVLIKTPGHTPGSQMIYVQLQTNEEFLFLGDVA